MGTATMYGRKGYNNRHAYQTDWWSADNPVYQSACVKMPMYIINSSFELGYIDFASKFKQFHRLHLINMTRGK